MSEDHQTQQTSEFFAVIPAGGVGSRLWPLSRAAAPKFLHDLTGGGRSLLQGTWDRLLPVADADHIVLVTGSSHEDAVTEQLPELQAHRILLESEPKDSAAAIGLAAAVLFVENPDVVIGSFAADHVVVNDKVFIETVQEAIVTAGDNKVVAVGITPTFPATGFGYIKTDSKLDLPGAPHAYKVAEFEEKPDLITASRYVESGEYSWNAGMFVSKASLLLDILSRTQPELHRGLLTIAKTWGTPEQEKVFAEIWPTLPKIAIDYAVAEPAAEQGLMAVVPGDFGWDDVGDFATLSKLTQDNRLTSGEKTTDRDKNDALAVLGDSSKVSSEDSSGIVVSSTDRVISVLGLEDIVIVDTDDALLVTTKDHAQQVKKMVEKLKGTGNSQVL